MYQQDFQRWVQIHQAINPKIKVKKRHKKHNFKSAKQMMNTLNQGGKK